MQLNVLFSAFAYRYFYVFPCFYFHMEHFKNETCSEKKINIFGCFYGRYFVVVALNTHDTVTVKDGVCHWSSDVHIWLTLQHQVCSAGWQVSHKQWILATIFICVCQHFYSDVAITTVSLTSIWEQNGNMVKCQVYPDVFIQIKYVVRKLSIFVDGASKHILIVALVLKSTEHHSIKRGWMKNSNRPCHHHEPIFIGTFKKGICITPGTRNTFGTWDDKEPKVVGQFQNDTLVSH